MKQFHAMNRHSTSGKSDFVVNTYEGNDTQQNLTQRPNPRLFHNHTKLYNSDRLLASS